jgi:aminoglycoside phosphotransferase (APT) family kinase protein
MTGSAVPGPGDDGEGERMRPLRHSYTNRTLGDGVTVVKHYQGPGALARSRRERAVLGALQGRLPVPAVLSAHDEGLTMAFVRGIHGQELLDAGRAGDVLRACGAMLRRIHSIDTSEIAAALPGPAGAGSVLVHGDYGPNNVLLDPATADITAVLDWEWAHAGDPAEDLAWCEWIVRMHHPGHASLLGEFFGGYGGDLPPWPARQAIMTGRCRSLLDFCHRHEPGGAGEAQWAHRLAVTEAWSE